MLALSLKASLLVCTLLVTNICAHLLQLKANCRDGIPSCPAVFAREVALSATQLTSNSDGTVSLQKTDPRRYRMLWRDLDASMHVIRHQVACNDAACLLTSQRMEDGAEGLPNLAIQAFASPLGYILFLMLRSPP